MNTAFADLGLGVLSWRGYDSLRATLTSYRDAQFFDLFSETLLFLPEIGDQGKAIAQEFNLPFAGHPNNLGILGGFKAMAENMTSSYIMLAENDFVLIASAIESRAMVGRALIGLQSGAAQVWRFRHLQTPRPCEIHKIKAYWPPENTSIGEKIMGSLRRLLRPKKALRISGKMVYLYPDADKRFPDHIKRTKEDDFLVRSDVLPWANNVFLINRNFFLNTVIPIAEAHISNRLVNGFPCIETELNRSAWWIEQRLWIGVSNPGLFTHERLGDRGY